MMNVAAVTGVLALALLSGSTAFAQGTGLSMDLTTTLGECVNGVSEVTVAYTVTSTGAADSATVSYSVSGGISAVGTLPTIASGLVTDGGGWTKGQGAIKTAGGELKLSLANGEYDIEVCAEQHGSDGNPDKQACNSVHVQVNCALEGTCDQRSELFGEVVGNKNLCQSESRINVQVKGLFGPTAMLEVKDQGGALVGLFSTTRAGDSCVYHWNLDPKTWAAATAGFYTFRVIGENGATYDFGANLTCSKPRR
jgi:hypothetical protein